MGVPRLEFGEIKYINFSSVRKTGEPNHRGNNLKNIQGVSFKTSCFLVTKDFEFVILGKM